MYDSKGVAPEDGYKHIKKMQVFVSQPRMCDFLVIVVVEFYLSIVVTSILLNPCT